MSVDLIGFLGVVMLAYVVPGPDFLVVVRSAAEHPSKGRAAALGAQAGLCVHMVAAAVGLSVVAARSPAVYDAIKLLGAAYLVHLGIRAVLAARRAARDRSGATGTDGPAVPEAPEEEQSPGARRPVAVRVHPRAAHQCPQPQGSAVLPEHPAAVRPR